jgi:hypothetical protein
MACVLVNPDKVLENPGSTRTGWCLFRDSKKKNFNNFKKLWRANHWD